MKVKNVKPLNLKEKKEMIITIPCRRGLHMRTAANFINYVKQFKSNILLAKGNISTDAKSMLGILCLGAGWGSHVKIQVTGEDSAPTQDAIKRYFEAGVGCVDND